MRHIEILLPFALPPAELAPDLLRELAKPAQSASETSALPTLLARGTLADTHRIEDFTGVLPHENWLARRFGLEAMGTGLPLASAGLTSYGLAAEPGWWFILNPVHLHVARDHLVLTDPRQLQLDEAEARVLFEAALTLFEASGRTLLYGDANTWFMRADDWRDLDTSTPDAVAGHNIDIWMPRSADDSGHPRQWRKLQNEVQMEWHIHPMNEEREARGDKPVNSLWLWGGSALPPASVKPAFSEVFNLPPSLRPLAALGSRALHAARAQELLASAARSAESHPLLVWDPLQEAAMAGDWGNWLLRMRTLEADWLAPLLDALKGGALDRISLVLTDSLRTMSIDANRASLRKFWVKPALSRLLP